MSIDQDTFDKIARFVVLESGIKLSKNKAYMMETRLAPILTRFGISSFQNLAMRLLMATAELRQAVVDAMTTNESFFFRDQTPFDLFNNIILPKLVEQKSGTGKGLNIWCAAAATGQEAYSMAISVLENAKLLEGLNVKILATDISQSALKTAQDGLYNQFEAQRGLSAQRLITHFDQEGTAWRVKPNVRALVEFKELNLLQPLGNIGRMDIVFCRNVLIYFDVETKQKVLLGIRKQMNPDGYLMLGAAETLIGISKEFLPTGEHQNLFQPASSL